MKLTPEERKMIASAAMHTQERGYLSWESVPEEPNKAERRYMLDCLLLAKSTIGSMEKGIKRIRRTTRTYNDLTERLRYEENTFAFQEKLRRQ